MVLHDDVERKLGQLPCLIKKKNVEPLTRHSVFTENELRSRYEIMPENYAKTVMIEATTMADMARREILPAVMAYAAEVAGGAEKKRVPVPALQRGYETEPVERLTGPAGCDVNDPSARVLSNYGASGT